MREQLSYSLTTFIQYVLFPLCVVVGIGSASLQLVYATSPTTVVSIVIALGLAYWIGLWLYRCKRVIATGYRCGRPRPGRFVRAGGSMA